MKKFTLFLRLLVLVLMTNMAAQAQIKLGDNPGTIDANSLLELESSTKGLLFPRMADAAMTGMVAPPAGMVVYNTTFNCLFIRRASDWFSLCNADPSSTTMGFLLPRVTTAQMNAITAPVGQIVYNTTTNCVYTLTAAAAPNNWVSLCNTASNGLTMTGTDVGLGGTLTGNTTIAAGTGGTAFTLNLTGDNPLTLPGLLTGATNNIVTLGAGGVLQTRPAGDILNTTAWKIDGNSGTTAGTNFIGTTDAQALVVKTAGTEKMRVLATVPPAGEVAGAVAVGRTSAFSTFHLGGSIGMPITNQSATYTVATTDYTVIGDCTTAGFTMTLPDPTTCSGRMYVLIKGDATNNILTFTRPIFLSAAQSMSSVNYNVRLHIQSDGTQWWLIARF